MNMRNAKWANDFSPLQPDGPSFCRPHIQQKHMCATFLRPTNFLECRLPASTIWLSICGWWERPAKHIVDGTFPQWKKQMVEKLGRRL